jgi:fructokinase
MAAPLALGVDLGGTKIEAAVLDADGALRWRERVRTPAGDYAATLHAVAALVRRAGAAVAAPLTVGVGHPGTLTPAGAIKNANSTCLNGQPLQSDLEALLGQPVRLANDANCLALSEATDGAGAGHAVVLAVILGTGVGGGLAVHGRVLVGANGLAGEWGHNPLPWADADEAAAAPPCYCGQRGCIEAWLSGPALAQDHARHTRGAAGAAADPAAAAGADAAPTGEQVAAAAADGDAAARATLGRHAHRLARALAATINLLDPDVIVLGGGLSRLTHLYAEVPALWERWVFSAGADAPLRTRLRPARHGDASGVRGAAWLWR